MATEIISNGSKWYGEAPDPIDVLWPLFESHELREWSGVYALWGRKGYIDRAKRAAAVGRYCAHGNFTGLSHVFNIDTDDPALVRRFRLAIARNKLRARAGGFDCDGLAVA